MTKFSWKVCGNLSYHFIHCRNEGVFFKLLKIYVHLSNILCHYITISIYVALTNSAITGAITTKLKLEILAFSLLISRGKR